MIDPHSPQKRRNRWLEWEPKGVISSIAFGAGPTKPAEPGSAGFVGPVQDIRQKISCPNEKADLLQGINSPSWDTAPADGCKESTNGDHVAVSPQADEEMLEWRRELSRRLKEIRERHRATANL